MQTLQFRKKTASWRILVLAMLLSAVMLRADDTNSPSITQEPQGRSVTESEIVRLSVTASGAEPLSYQWRRKGEPLFGESRAQLVIWGVRETDSGDYTV
ncbi:MAG: immunoglobulin domain-containing protein, partial [Verrucomicrobiota bacterium]